MAEFTECYYLHGDDTNAAVELLRRAKLPGFVFPPLNGWTTVLIEGLLLAPNRCLIEANTGVLLHYLMAEDHGWSFEVYEGPATASRFTCHVQNGLAVDKAEVNFDRLLELAKQVNPDPDVALDLARFLDPGPEAEILGFAGDAEGFAAAMKLPHHAGYSYDDLLMSYEPDDEEFVGVIQLK